MTIDSGLNVGKITFGPTAAPNDTTAFVIGSAGANAGNTLILSSGAIITVNSYDYAAQVINAPLLIYGTQADFDSNSVGGASGTLTVNGNISAGASSSTLTIRLYGRDTGNNTIAGVIGGGNGATIAISKITGYSGLWILSGANTYTSGTSVAQGTLEAGISSVTSGSGSSMTITNGAFGTGLLTVNGGTVDLSTNNVAVGGLSDGGFSTGKIASSATSGSGETLTIVTNSTPETYSGTIANTPGTGSKTLAVAIDGTGTQVFSGANTYTGATTISAGTLVAGISNSGSTSGAFGPTNGTTGVVTLGDANTSSASPKLLINGAFTVANPITVANFGTTDTIGGSNTTGTANYTGNITLNKAVTLQAATGGTVDFNTGTWTTNSNTVNVGSTGNTGIVKIDNAVTSTGGINVNYGTLNYTTTALTSSVNVASGATLGSANSMASNTLSGNGSITGLFTAGTSGRISPGPTTAGTAGTLTFNGGLTLNSGAILAIDLSGTNALGGGGTTGGTNDLIYLNGGALTIGGSTTINIDAIGTLLTGSSNPYTIINGATSASGNLTAGNFTINVTGAGGSGDVAHLLTTAGNNLEIYFTSGSTPAAQSFTAPSPVPLRIMTGTSTAVSATLNNTAASTSPLAVSLGDSSTGSVGSVGTFTGPSTVAASSNNTVGGTFTASGSGTGTWGLTNTDANATPTTASTGGAVTVYTKSTPSLSTGSVSFGAVHQGATGVTVASNLQNAAGPNVAGLQVTSLASGLTGPSVGTVIAQGGSSALTAAVNTATVGSTPQTYGIGTSDDQTITGFSANGTTTLTATGQVYSGAGVWTGTGSGGSWGTPTLTPANWTANGGVPGLAGSPFNTTDSATFGTTSTAQSVTLDGQSPYLNTVTFNNASTGSYNLAPGTGGTIHLDSTGTANITNTAGSNTISAPVELDANTAASVAVSTDTLTISGPITESGSHSLAGRAPVRQCFPTRPATATPAARRWAPARIRRRCSSPTPAARRPAPVR